MQITSETSGLDIETQGKIFRSKGFLMFHFERQRKYLETKDVALETEGVDLKT